MSSPAKKGEKIPKDMVLTNTDQRGNMTPRSADLHEIHRKIRADVNERFVKINDALDNPKNQHYENIVKVGKTWFGEKVERNDLKLWTSAMAENFPRLSISIKNFGGNHRGEAPGRLTGKFHKFPGLAIESNTKNKPIPPGIDINARYMPQKIDDESKYKKIMWTYVHEASHAILSTTDYSYLDTRQTIPVLTRGGPNSLPTVMTHNDYEIKKKNADHHAGFFTNASRLLNPPVEVTPSFPPIASPPPRPLPQTPPARLPPITPRTGGTATGTSSPATSLRQAPTSFPLINSARKPGAPAFVKSFRNP